MVKRKNSIVNCETPYKKHKTFYSDSCSSPTDDSSNANDILSSHNPFEIYNDYDYNFSITPIPTPPNSINDEWKMENYVSDQEMVNNTEWNFNVEEDAENKNKYIKEEEVEEEETEEEEVEDTEEVEETEVEEIEEETDIEEDEETDKEVEETEVEEIEEETDKEVEETEVEEIEEETDKEVEETEVEEDEVDEDEVNSKWNIMPYCSIQ